MTNEEAKAFLDNLKICIEEHPIVADWLVEIADRKTEHRDCINCESADDCAKCRGFTDEPQTCEECEHWSDTEDGCADRHGCKFDPQNCDTCKHHYGKDCYDIDCERLALGNECRYESKTEPQTERSE